jgi:site-specific recombinase XerD
LAAAEISVGPVFRPVLKGSRVQPIALTARSVANIVKVSAELTGLDPAEFSGHSLRSGFLTSAAEAGASVVDLIGKFEGIGRLPP